MPPQTLIGPFAQILTMTNLPLAGPIYDEQLHIISDGGIVCENGKIIEIGQFITLGKKYKITNTQKISEKFVLIPGLIDCHTHICFAGSRAKDYAQRISGKSYLEIAKEGGGIMSTVHQTRIVSQERLTELLLQRGQSLLESGITTCEVKSGYGLSVNEELKILRAIKSAEKIIPLTFIPTCLAAHTRPPEFSDNKSYLNDILKNLLPVVKQENLSHRVDIFVEDSAFTPEEAHWYLSEAKKMGFEITVHADQFTTGGSLVAAQFGAISADHLEASGLQELQTLKTANVVAVVLPGASLGLGTKFAPARKILDEGLTLAIASDWNPGSAPMGDLLTQAAILGAAEKLTLSETLAGITTRAAKSLGLTDRGNLSAGKLADFTAFPSDDYREILYHQGKMRPAKVWKNGVQI